METALPANVPRQTALDATRKKRRRHCSLHNYAKTDRETITRLDWKPFSRFFFLGDAASVPKLRRQRHGLWTPFLAALALTLRALSDRRKGK